MLTIILIASVIFKILLLDNPSFLFFIAGGLDRPSRLYFHVTKNIYAISSKSNLSEKLLRNLEKDRNKHIHDLYIHTLGVIGEYKAIPYLIKAYAEYQNESNRRYMIYRIILSLGMIGNEDSIPFLETLLRDYEKLQPKIEGYCIARALYLCTGDIYKYTGLSGEKTILYVGPKLSTARSIITTSKGRSRTIEEMITLGKLGTKID